MRTTTLKFGDHVLEMRQAVIEVSSISATKPDPTWFYQDLAGHEHRYEVTQDGGSIKHEVPTVETVNDGEPYFCNDCKDEHQDTKTVCKQCGETIRPHRLPDPGPHFIPGMREYFLDGEPVIRNQVNEFLAAQWVNQRI